MSLNFEVQSECYIMMLNIKMRAPINNVVVLLARNLRFNVYNS